VEKSNARDEALLLLSVGTHSRSRPLGPVETGKRLAVRCQKEPREVVAKKYGLSVEMLREFLVIADDSKLSEKSQKILDSWKIGIDKSYRVSMLANAKDQEELARAIVEHDLKIKEVRSVIQHLKRRNASLPIAQCIDLVLKSRPEIEKHHLFLTEVEVSTLEDLRERAKLGNTSPEVLLKTSLGEFLPSGSLLSLTLRNTLVHLSLNQEGFQSLKLKGKELGVELDNLIEILTRKSLGR
jgi:hypothetical protein